VGKNEKVAEVPVSTFCKDVEIGTEITLFVSAPMVDEPEVVGGTITDKPVEWLGYGAKVRVLDRVMKGHVPYYEVTVLSDKGNPTKKRGFLSGAMLQRVQAVYTKPNE
jgi:hypothetical protein